MKCLFVQTAPEWEYIKNMACFFVFIYTIFCLNLDDDGLPKIISSFDVSFNHALCFDNKEKHLSHIILKRIRKKRK